MLFTQFNMEDALAVRYEEGVEDGFERGRAEGSTVKLIQQIQKKLQKGLTAKEIAEDLEESLEHVKQICEAIGRCKEKEAEAIWRFMQDFPK